jgi:hypothetical protein
MRKKPNPGNVASWIDKDAKKKSLAQGRAKAYKTRRNAGKNSFTDEHRKTLSVKKLEQYHNYIGIYLIENKMNTDILMQFTKRLNTPNFYVSDLKFKQAIETFVFDVNKEFESTLTYTIASELISKSLKIKLSKLPLQMASINQRERRKSKKL